MNKISVVITAFNEEKTLEDCLKSVKDWANEIVVVDNNSSDKTATIAKQYTAHVFHQENNPQNIDIQKNFGIKKASNEWVLILDADERVDKELKEEIDKIDESEGINGYWIPRKNIIFGKWIEHTGWYPDRQLRLIKKDKGEYKKGVVHQHIALDGTTEVLTSHITHLNYVSISQFLERTIFLYTVSESKQLITDGYVFESKDLIVKPVQEFNKRYFLEKGYKDGIHGLVLSLLMGFYHFVIYLRAWEAGGFKEKDNTLDVFGQSLKDAGREVNYWQNEMRIQDTKNPLKKGLYKVKRKAKL